jgi:hypothetical protein
LSIDEARCLARLNLDHPASNSNCDWASATAVLRVLHAWFQTDVRRCIRDNPRIVAAIAATCPSPARPSPAVGIARRNARLVRIVFPLAELRRLIRFRISRKMTGRSLAEPMWRVGTHPKVSIRAQPALTLMRFKIGVEPSHAA